MIAHAATVTVGTAHKVAEVLEVQVHSSGLTVATPLPGAFDGRDVSVPAANVLRGLKGLPLALDLQHVNFLDSRLQGVILALCKARGEADLVLTNVHPAVEGKLFKIPGLVSTSGTPEEISKGTVADDKTAELVARLQDESTQALRAELRSMSGPTGGRRHEARTHAVQPTLSPDNDTGEYESVKVSAPLHEGSILSVDLGSRAVVRVTLRNLVDEKAPELGSELVAHRGKDAVVLTLAGVDHLSEECVAKLLRARNELAPTELRLAEVGSSVHESLRIKRLLEILPVYPTEAAALIEA